jgi:hypothetical protein
MAPEAGLEPTTLRLTACEFPSPSTAINCSKSLYTSRLYQFLSALRCYIYGPIATDFELAWAQKWAPSSRVVRRPYNPFAHCRPGDFYVDLPCSHRAVTHMQDLRFRLIVSCSSCTETNSITPNESTLRICRVLSLVILLLDVSVPIREELSRLRPYSSASN